MTRSLAIFGDSLMDSGNLDQVAKAVGQNPFQEKIYNGSGNVRASDALVLGQHIARGLGASLSSTRLANIVTLPLLRFTGFGAGQIRDYSYAGATSGARGSVRSGLSRFPIGLKEQARAFALTTDKTTDLDALMTAGSNDITDLAADLKALKPVLATPGLKDDLRLQGRAARRIVRNVAAAYDRITGRVDETVILGLAPLSATPFVRSQASRLGAPLADRLTRFVDGVARTVNQGLAKRFAGRSDVLVVDGFQVWQSVANPVFLDDVHPTSATAQQLGGTVVGLIKDSHLESFGFS
jgi:phospholipase/lecithinase/hemolysin